MSDPTRSLLLGVIRRAALPTLALALAACANTSPIADGDAVCGNDTVESGEECDDGNTRNGDGCSSRCNDEGGGDSCGDGLVDRGEGCDDENTDAGDGCSATCEVEEGYECLGAPSECTPDAGPTCGDGVIEAPEVCDDGDAEAGDGCDAACAVEDGWACEGEPSVCSDGSTPVCGDGNVDPGEACDDDNLSAGDGCSGACSVEEGYSCVGSPSECTESGDPVCGNGAIEFGERCDDNNALAGDGCAANCTVEAGWVCTGAPSDCQREAVDPVCGNGRLETSEGCDDGDTDPGDGCSDLCAVEDGFECTGSPSVCAPPPPPCGNGRLDADEGCDDGDTDGGDGCDDACAVEDGWTCAGVPSVCTPPDRCAGVDCTGLDSPCGFGACDALTGECELVNYPNGRDCDDGDPCTSTDACQAGVCTGGGATDCSSLDGPCSEGFCEAGVGCTVRPLDEGASCDTDPADCATETCVAGACVAENFANCSPCGDGGLCGDGECRNVTGGAGWDAESTTLPSGFATSGDAPWATTTAFAHTGTRSVASGNIGDSSDSILTWTVDVPRATTIAFWYRIESESCCDDGRFLIDGTERLSVAGTVNWTEFSYALTPGRHTLTWTFEKDISLSSGTDTFYIDDIRIGEVDTCTADGPCGSEIPGAAGCIVCPLAEGSSCDSDSNECTSGVCTAGDCVESQAPDCETCGAGGACVSGACRTSQSYVLNQNFNGATLPGGWTTSAGNPWTVDVGAGPDGSNAVRSAPIGDSTNTWIQTSVTLPVASEVTFNFRTSTEEGYDELWLVIDGTDTAYADGEVPWTSYTSPLTAGTHTIRWVYRKDGSAVAGEDAVWIDNAIVIDPSTSCTSSAECGLSVADGGGCVECPAADGTTCAGGVCAAGVCE